MPPDQRFNREDIHHDCKNRGSGCRGSGLDLARVNPPLTSADNGLRIASVLDLAGTKIKVLQDRAELKDYLDMVAAIESGMTAADAVRAAMTIYGEDFNPMVSLKALTWFEDGDVRQLPASARHLLEEAIRSVDLGSLRPFTPDSKPFDSAKEVAQESTAERAPPREHKP